MSKNAIVMTVTLACFFAAGCESAQVKRYGSVIGVKKEKLEDYRELHANPWPEVNRKLKECNIRNYSITCDVCRMGITTSSVTLSMRAMTSKRT